MTSNYHLLADSVFKDLNDAIINNNTNKLKTALTNYDDLEKYYYIVRWSSCLKQLIILAFQCRKPNLTKIILQHCALRNNSKELELKPILQQLFETATHLYWNAEEAFAMINNSFIHEDPELTEFLLKYCLRLDSIPMRFCQTYKNDLVISVANYPDMIHTVTKYFSITEFAMCQLAFKNRLSQFKELMKFYTGTYRLHWFFHMKYINAKQEKQVFDIFLSKITKLTLRNLNSLSKQKPYLLNHILPYVEKRDNWSYKYYLGFSPLIKINCNFGSNLSFNALAKEDEHTLDVILRCTKRVEQSIFWYPHEQYVKQVNISKRIIAILYCAGFPSDSFTSIQRKMLKSIDEEQKTNIDKHLGKFIYIKELNGLVSEYLGCAFEFLTKI